MDPFLKSMTMYIFNKVTCIYSCTLTLMEVIVGEMMTTVDLGTRQHLISISPTFSSFSSFYVHQEAHQTFYSAPVPYAAHSQDVPIR